MLVGRGARPSASIRKPRENRTDDLRFPEGKPHRAGRRPSPGPVAWRRSRTSPGAWPFARRVARPARCGARTERWRARRHRNGGRLRCLGCPGGARTGHRMPRRRCQCRIGRPAGPRRCDHARLAGRRQHPNRAGGVVRGDRRSQARGGRPIAGGVGRPGAARIQRGFGPAGDRGVATRSAGDLARCERCANGPRSAPRPPAHGARRPARCRRDERHAVDGRFHRAARRPRGGAGRPFRGARRPGSRRGGRSVPGRALRRVDTTIDPAAGGGRLRPTGVPMGSGGSQGARRSFLPSLPVPVRLSGA